MPTVPEMHAGLADYTLADLERLEQERPELGRLEVIDGALHATGESAVGYLHQQLMQRLHLILAAACPPRFLVQLDTWWMSPHGKLRPDVAVYRAGDVPEDAYGAFHVAPLATVEILSDDAHHDLVRKDEIYAEVGARRAYLDMRRRFGWWCRLDGVDETGATATWQLDGWPPLVMERDALFPA